VIQVALDHTEYLGSSLEEIACEKAGIAKPGVPFVIGEPDEDIAAVLAEEAGKRGAVLRHVRGAYDGPIGLFGRHQKRNATVAAAILSELPAPLRPSEGAITEGFASASLPGRFDQRGRWIFDVAHNPDGVEALVYALAAARPPRPIHALVGILADKDWGTMLAALATVVDRVWVTDPPTAPPERKWDVRAVGRPNSRFVVEPDFDAALAGVQEKARTVLVTGSFHTVGDAMARLPGFSPLG
jgi:dihydrofolate synthase/folylpolyglutamate synthase